MKKIYQLTVTLLSIAGSVFAQPFHDGVYVINEGGFAAGNASMSFINAADQLQHNVYAAANSGAALGDTAQSMVFDGIYAYIVLNGSGSIRIVNRYTLEMEGTITGLVNPRYLVCDQGKLFVSCWGNPSNIADDTIAVIDVTTRTVLSNIPVVEGPERMVGKNGMIYVAHAGGYGFGTSVSVIDATALSVTASIAVGDNPNSIAEKDGVLYVMSGGKPSWSGSETFGSLLKYDLNMNSPIVTIAYPNQHPSNLRIDGNNLYYTSGTGVFKTDVSFDVLPTTPLFTTVNSQGVYGVYGLDIIDSKIYLADAGDYFTPGFAYVYSDAGLLLHTYTVGVIPNGFYKAEPNLAVPSYNLSSNLTVYPNPALDVLYLNTDKEAAIRIFDLAGRTVKTVQYQTTGIDVSDLTQGIYSMEATIENQSTVKRFIVK